MKYSEIVQVFLGKHTWTLQFAQYSLNTSLSFLSIASPIYHLVYFFFFFFPLSRCRSRTGIWVSTNDFSYLFYWVEPNVILGV